jgi:hypothetical protein
MIVSTIMLKLGEGTDKNISAIKQKLLAMKEEIKQIKELVVETNIRSGVTSHDVLMIAKYASMQDFDEYVSHPFHVNVGKQVQEVCKQIASVCYEE